jgi:hypothetical protein
MAALSRDAHRRRVLEYQAKVEMERSAPTAGPSDPQLKIPLIGEVKRSDGTPQPKRRRPRGQKHVQPELGEP